MHFSSQLAFTAARIYGASWWKQSSPEDSWLITQSNGSAPLLGYAEDGSLTACTEKSGPVSKSCNDSFLSWMDCREACVTYS